MQIFGLTGGIASGKSTVARLLRAQGAAIVDADKLAREVVATGSDGLAAVVAAFGEEIVQADGQLDRKALGARVFADSGSRAKLNAILHPRIAQAGQDALAHLAAQGVTLAFYEAPLIVENNLHQGMDGLIVVSLPEETQVARLQQRDGISEGDARARLAAQLPLANKLAVASHVIDNSGSSEETTQQVEALWRSLNRDAQITSK